MKYVNSGDLISLFSEINIANLNYILIRNINNELPFKLEKGKDIDILIKYEDKSLFHNFFKKNGFKKIKHPYRHDIYLYGVPKFEFFKKNDMIIDLNYVIACRSLNNNEWIPLDQVIQKSSWSNRIFIRNDFDYYSLSLEDELISLIVRSIFDKKEFISGYIFRIEWIFQKINEKIFKEKLELVFFKYTETLIKQIRKKEYSDIINNYISFKEY
jgi:hypothetical protein